MYDFFHYFGLKIWPPSLVASYMGVRMFALICMSSLCFHPQQYVKELPRTFNKSPMGYCFTHFWGPGRRPANSVANPAFGLWLLGFGAGRDTHQKYSQFMEPPYCRGLNLNPKPAWYQSLYPNPTNPLKEPRNY